MEKEFKDFTGTPYYQLYKKRIQEYSDKIVKSIVEMQWIDNEVKFTRWDVLKEVYKFVNKELVEFPDDIDLNPTQERERQFRIEKAIEEQSKQMVGMN